jgi:hypothetical protein
MRILLLALLGVLLFCGTALADDDFDNWGTAYYDQVIGGSHAAGCTSCGQVAAGGCAHCGATAAPAAGHGCASCGQANSKCSSCGQAAKGGCAKCGGSVKAHSSCASCGQPAAGCKSCGAHQRSGCDGGTCGYEDYDYTSAWAWMFE